MKWGMNSFLYYVIEQNLIKTYFFVIIYFELFNKIPLPYVLFSFKRWIQDTLT